jgi:hypothetical protein
MQDLLRELGRQLGRVADRPGPRGDPPAGPATVDVLYALTPVVDGQALSGRLLVGLPHHPGGDDDRWAGVDWQEMGRVIAQAVARASGGPSTADAERTSRLSDDTVVTLDLVRRPSTAAPVLVPTS